MFFLIIPAINYSISLSLLLLFFFLNLSLKSWKMIQKVKQLRFYNLYNLLQETNIFTASSRVLTSLSSLTLKKKMLQFNFILCACLQKALELLK